MTAVSNSQYPVSRYRAFHLTTCCRCNNKQDLLSLLLYTDHAIAWHLILLVIQACYKFYDKMPETCFITELSGYGALQADNHLLFQTVTERCNNIILLGFLQRQTGMKMPAGEIPPAGT